MLPPGWGMGLFSVLGGRKNPIPDCHSTFDSMTMKCQPGLAQNSPPEFPSVYCH